ncbi:MAG: hypothetical protein AB1515_02425 [Nitrospirota bacterium]
MDWAKRPTRLLFGMMVLAVAVTLCGIDHLGLQSDLMAGHAHGAAPECVPDLCVTATSNDTSWAGKTALFWLLGLALTAGLITPLLVDPKNAWLIHAHHPPRASNKLYRLHAVFLL